MTSQEILDSERLIEGHNHLALCGILHGVLSVLAVDISSVVNQLLTNVMNIVKMQMGELLPAHKRTGEQLLRLALHLNEKVKERYFYIVIQICMDRWK